MNQGNDFVPTIFKKAVLALEGQLRGVNFNRVNESRFKAVLKKMSSGGALRPDEMYVLLRTSDKLNAQEIVILKGLIGRAVGSRADYMDELALETLRLFSPEVTLEIAFETELFQMSDKIPNLVRESPHLGPREFLEDLLRKGEIVAAFSQLCSIGVSRGGVKLILSHIFGSNIAIQIFDSEIVKIIDGQLLLGLSKPEILLELEEIAAFYIKNDNGWSSKLLNKARSVGAIIYWAIGCGVPLSIKLKNIHQLIAAYKELENSLRDLDQKVPERGEYWRRKIDLASRVIPRRFDGGMLIGVALYFGEYVLVEFGPIGNSAYIYRADVFQSKILNQPSWQSRELVDRNITLQGSRPGSLWHVAGWMNTADRFLMQIVKRP